MGYFIDQVEELVYWALEKKPVEDNQPRRMQTIEAVAELLAAKEAGGEKPECIRMSKSAFRELCEEAFATGPYRITPPEGFWEKPTLYGVPLFVTPEAEWKLEVDAARG